MIRKLSPGAALLLELVTVSVGTIIFVWYYYQLVCRTDFPTVIYHLLICLADWADILLPPPDTSPGLGSYDALVCCFVMFCTWPRGEGPNLG